MVVGIAGWSIEGAEIVGGLLALVVSVGYFRGSS